MTHRLRTVWRTLIRQRGYTLLHILGLAAGLASAALLLLYVMHETSFDRMHPDADRTVVFWEDADWQGQIYHIPLAPAVFGPSMEADIPEIERAVRVGDWSSSSVAVGTAKRMLEVGVADPELFDLMAFPEVRRLRPDALTTPRTAAISTPVAESFFGDADPLGQTMRFDDSMDITVEAVYEPLPGNTHLDPYDIILSMETRFLSGYAGESGRTDWYSHNYVTYLTLVPGTDVAALEAKIAPYLMEKAGEEARESWTPWLMLMTGMHLYDREGQVAMFGWIAGFILLIAGINYVNLATARSFRRRREIGVRKVLGGSRAALIGQFLTESVMVALLAGPLAWAMVELSLPGFDQLAGITLRESLGLNTLLVGGGMLILAAAVGLLAGLYPALALSSHAPVRSLRGIGMSEGAGRRSLPRLGLVTVQFALSLGLIFATLTVLHQHQHLLQRDLGFKEDGIIYLNLPSRDLREQAGTLRAELLKHPRITEASLHGNVIGRQVPAVYGVSSPQLEGSRAVTVLFSDNHLVSTMGMELLWGRAMSDSITTDRLEAFLVNETFVEVNNLDMEGDRQITLHGQNRVGEIVGVVKDLHYNPLKQKIDPLLISGTRHSWDQRELALRITPGPLEDVVDYIETTWDSFDPLLPAEVHFLDTWLEDNYTAERRTGQLLSLFAGLAVLIALLGLLGLAAYATQTRTKEIGIRKVLGAGRARIILLLTRDFAIPMVLGSGVGLAAAGYWMSAWLQDFPYHISLPWTSFGFAMVAVALLAWGTMALTTLRAASRNPVHALRNE